MKNKRETICKTAGCLPFLSFTIFRRKQHTSHPFELHDFLPEQLFTAPEMSRQAADAEKTCCTPVHHLFIQSNLVRRQRPSALPANHQLASTILARNTRQSCGAHLLI